MSDHFASWDDVTLELAADLVTEGLDPADHLQLEASTLHDDLEAFELAVAEIALGGLEELEAPPVEVSERLKRSADAWVAASSLYRDDDSVESRIAAPAPKANPWLGAGGWLAAAAMAVAFFALRGGDAPETTPSASALRGTLVAQADDLVRHKWVNTEDPGSAGVSGDVVWSRDLQEGYMVFEGLEPNDPTKEQYQLWVFDNTRFEWEEKPVDGGVFDVDASGKVTIKIDPKLEIREPALFAITIEQPGGVVVSERERLVLISEFSG